MGVDRITKGIMKSEKGRLRKALIVKEQVDKKKPTKETKNNQKTRESDQESQKISHVSGSKETMYN